MMSIVSFDIFPPFDHIDADFSELPSWSPYFEWMGYESANFLENLGSIVIFITVQALFLFVTILLSIYEIRLPCRRLREKFTFASMWSSSLTLINGAFFEILVSISVSMSMVTFVGGDYFSDLDNVSVILSLLFTLIMTSYILFVFYLVCCKSGQLYTVHRAQLVEKTIKIDQDEQNKSILENLQKAECSEELVDRMKLALVRMNESKERLVEEASRIEKS